MALVFSVAIFLGVGLTAGQNLVCQKEVWHPADSNPPYNHECMEYDGSLIPDCDYFLNNYTSYYHVHEYGKRYLYQKMLMLNYFVIKIAPSSGNVVPLDHA